MKPNSVDTTIRKSKTLYKSRDYLGAISVLEHTLARFPNNRRLVTEIISIQKKFASSQLELPSMALLNEVLTLVKSNDLKNSLSKTNELFQTLKNENAATAAARKTFLEDPDNIGKAVPPELRGFFRETEIEAVSELGRNVKKINIEEARVEEAGITNPLLVCMQKKELLMLLKKLQ